MAVERKIAPGASMPKMSLPAVDGRQVQLGGEGRWQVAVVYRGRHCPLCRKYLKTLDGLLDDFRGIGADVIALSGDPRDRAHEEAIEENWRFPVACELSLDQMRELGLYISEPRSEQETDRPFPEPGCSRAVYLHCAETAGVRPAELALVAAHGWDIHGAGSAGLITGFVARENEPFPVTMRPPDVSGSSLTEVVDALLR